MNFDEIKKQKEEYESLINHLSEEIKINEEKRSKSLEEGFGSVSWATRSLTWNQTINSLRAEKTRAESKRSLLDRYEDFYNNLSPQGREIFDIIVFIRQHELTMGCLLK